MSQQSRELTGLRIPWGLFHFTVIPFGLHGAPATFQRLMDKVLFGLSHFASAYLDDDVVYSHPWEEHLEHLKSVFEFLGKAGLTINPGKCMLARAEVEYLGYVIRSGVIKQQAQKMEAIRACPLPQTRTQLRSFIGMAGWYHRFIPNYSARAAVLTDMVSLRHPNQLLWTEEAKNAFMDIQQGLGGDTLLHCPDFEKQFILQTDASD